MGKCYTLIGNNEILINNKIIEIKKTLDNSYDETRFNMDEISLVTLLEELKTFPFLTDEKLIIIRRCDFLNKKTDERLINEFFNYLKKPLQTTNLIIILEPSMEKSKNITEIKNNTIVYPLNDIEPLDFINALVKLESFTINRNASEELITRTNGNLALIKVELEKLFLYKYNEKIIDYNDITILVNKSLEDNIYNLVDAVLQKQKARIMEIYLDMMVLNEEETRIIAALLGKFSEMHDVRLLIENGYTQNDLASIYNVKSGRAYYMVQNAKTTSLKEIKRNIELLGDLDYKIKSGKIDKRLGLELYLLTV